MWVTTQHGFFNAVSTKNNAKSSTILVHARDADDLRRVRSAGYELGRIFASLTADYPYHVVMERAEWGRYLADQALGINYTSFRSRIEKLDLARSHIYSKVWSVLRHIEDGDRTREIVPMVAADEQHIFGNSRKRWSIK